MAHKKMIIQRVVIIEFENQFILIVYQNASMTSAAHVLGISQPALSMRISKVEEKLGFKVFDRKSNPLALTKEGRIYIEYLKSQERLLKDYRNQLYDLQNHEERYLVIGGPSVYLESMISEAVATLHTIFPKCKITVKCATLPELIEQANEGALDCFISTSVDLPKEFVINEVKEEQLFLCIPMSWDINEVLKGYEVISRVQDKTFDFQLLNGLEFISMEEGQPLQKALLQFMKEYKIQPKTFIEVNQVTTGIAIASCGGGIFLASEDAIANSGLRDQILIYPLPKKYSGRKIYVAYNKKNYLSKPCKTLIEILKKM